RFFGVGRGRGRFLRVFERLAIYCVSDVCKISADLSKASVDLGKISLRLFSKRCSLILPISRLSLLKSALILQTLETQ
ncbi:MAG: hypothetical protein SPK15_04815, partial [Candidatus Onthomorpha sp.]|nr:hypothetical protein [Candidatus Onthomorpha sp.]